METTKLHKIDSSIIEDICSSISDGKPVNATLPENGLLHIDKLLPFICVYRYSEMDVYFSRIVKTQASYLIVNDEVDITHLLEAIRVIVSNKFETFLIMEFWPEKDNKKNTFHISCPKGKAPATVAALKDGFESLQDIYPNIDVEVDDTHKRHPTHLDPIFNVDESKKKGTLVIGVTMPTLYKNDETNELYSLFFREYYSVFSETVKRAIFEFIRVQTTDDFKHYLMLGKTHIDNITSKSDAQLAEISEGMSFLLRTTPINSNEEWLNFKKNEFEKIKMNTQQIK